MPTSIPPATWGVMHGSGFLEDAIRWVEQHESKSDRFPDGDREAAWAGHVVIATTGGNIVQAVWPKVTVDPAPAPGSVIWASGQPLTGIQRTAGVATAQYLVGTRYDIVAYGYFMGRLVDLPVSHDYKALAQAEAKAGPICSGAAIRMLEAMNVDLGPLKTAALADPDWVSPADLLRWGLDNGWMSAKVPAW